MIAQKRIFFLALGFSVYSIICFLLGFYLKTLGHSPVVSDAEFFFDFMGHFPVLYSKERWGFYPVLYLPSFVFYYFPFYLTSESFAFYSISAINFICIFYIVKLSFQINNTYAVVTILVLVISTYTLSIWGNPEIQTTLISTYILSVISREKDYKDSHIFLLAFFSFKIINLMILLPILFEIGFRKTLKFVFLLLSFLFLLNFWYLIVNADFISIAFFIDLTQNKPEAIASPLVMIYRISLSIPVIYSGVNLIKIKKS